ncbi:hypothetical protein [Sphingosinicella rhizophila]|uniref:ABC-2 type transport system permease protein n=1 Tax=Sphingosinicella rhizophila TaxID=3050082 RepID=A0ABU3Q9T8_9SPHN|nr:hypothetical protein [Sphingosinicella sp. GR2756]MDT9600159.1 hypothetical protein [Sphingosinicella sp. GR2756]
MSAVAVARSSLVTSLSRYSYSWGLWLLLLLAPVGARFMIAPDDGAGIQVAIGGHLPFMTSPTLGVTLGIVVSTLLLPIGFLYLRSNVTRVQPWQIEEVTAASRVAIMLGRFAADVAILFAMLAALTLAGWFLGWLIGSGPLNVWHITMALWLVAAPPLMLLAGIRIFFDSLRITRRGFGEFLYFCFWLASIAVPAAMSDTDPAYLKSTYATNMIDSAGFIRPLAGPDPKEMGQFSIGSTDIEPGRVPLDAMAGLHAPGYMASRLSWAAIAVALAAFAGLVYQPHIARNRIRKRDRIARWFARTRPPAPADPAAPPALPAAVPFIGLVKAEFRLIGGGRLFMLLAAIVALLGLGGDYRGAGSPAALLLLIFALTAQAGRTEARGLRPLAGTTLLTPWHRRAAFVLAGILWALLMAFPACFPAMSAEPLLLALATGGAASLITIALAAFSGSAFAPRMVLLVLWYGYFSAS